MANAAYLAQGLAELGFTRYGTDDPGAASGIVTVSHPDVQGVFDALNQQQIIISVRNKLLRFSPTYYNDRVELDRTLAFWRFEAEATGAALSKDLKKRGWKFVGPTTVYAFMQAMGLVNDHAADCVTAAEVAEARRAFRRPSA